MEDGPKGTREAQEKMKEEKYITRTINGKEVKFPSKVWAVVPKTYTAELFGYDDLPWFEPYYETRKEAMAAAKRIRYAAVRTGKSLWSCREFRKFWFKVTGEKITIAPALVDIKTGKVVRWLDEEKK